MSQNWDITTEARNKPAFYEQDSGATTIMTLANFPDEVLPLLQMESLITYEAMVYFRCEALVELGCYDGRALEIARLLNTRYLGIDLNPRAIQLLRRRIEREGMADRAKTIIGDVLTHTAQDQTLIDSRTLCLLPFNLLGNFRDPTQLLKQLAMLDVTAVICVFSNSSEATRVRHDYYLRCGVQQLELYPQEDGVVFTGAEGFYSRSYTRAAFHTLLTQCGLTIVRTSESLLAYCATVKLDTNK